MSLPIEGCVAELSMPAATFYDGWGRMSDSAGKVPESRLRVIATSESIRAWEGDHCVLDIATEALTAVQVSDGTTTSRRMPVWAAVLGIIGLFFFLIGIVFFFVKETVNTPGTLVSLMTKDGRTLILSTTQPYGAGQAQWWPLAMALHQRAAGDKGGN